MKRKKVLIILLVLLGIMSIVGISYARWLFTSKQRNFNTLGSKCFELTMMNETEGITLNKTYPISDEEGLSTTGYTFTIKNTCNTYATYEVNLEDMLVEEKRLSGEYIKVSINDGTPVNLKNLEEKEAHIEESDKSYELTSGSLGPEEETTYTIKLWMDESTPAIEETMNATFLSKISIEAGYIPEENLENEILIEAKSITESLNNKSEVFEITGTSTNYNLIEYSLDKSHWSRIENPSTNITITQEFQEEGKHSIYVRDEVGNIKEIEIQTTKLDKTVPEIKIEETDNQENVELHITFTDNEGLGGYDITESSEEPTEWTSIEGKETTIEYTLTENATYYIWVKDSVGNISYQKYSTDTIDTQAPELEITNILTDWGVKDTITIKATDDIVGISGISISKVEETYNWEFVENTLSYETTKKITENGTYYISVRDAYGHITTKSIVIDKVDNILPRIEQLTSDSEWNTINQITGSLQDNESGLSGYQITKEKIEPKEYIEINGPSYELNYEVSENGIYYIWVKDSVGNVYQTEIEVTKVDVTAPVLSSITNSSNGSWAQSITLSWNIEESGSGISKVEYSTDNNIWNELSKEEWYGITRTDERDDTIYIRVTDNVGNVSNIESTVLKIDRTAPSAPVITNNKNNVWSKDSVTVSMKSTDNRSGIARYEWYENGSWTTRAMNINDGIGSITYGAQRNETIRIRAVDNAGNVSSESTTIVKVDTTNPITKISARVSGNSIRISASGSSDTNSGIKNYQYSRDNSTWYTSTSDSYTFTGLADGTYTVYVKVTDNSGRTSIASTSVTVAYVNVYVASYGNDSTGNGSSASPYATVQKAYAQVSNNGNINLLSNISVTQTIRLTSNKNIQFQGSNSTYSLVRTDSIKDSALLVISNSNVTLTNITIDGKNIASTYYLVEMGGNATVNLNSGSSIINANMQSAGIGGAMYMNSSNLYINGGSISNNTSNNLGAAMVITNHSNVTLNYGNIDNNKTLDANSGGGGAIYLDGGNLTINNGSISNNYSPYIGGAILVASRPYSQTITIKGGSMVNNSATNGGFIAIYTPGGSTNMLYPLVSVEAGNIADNKASSQGGAFYLNGGNVNLNGGEITRNSAGASGGGIFVTNSSAVNMSNGYVSNNTAGSSSQQTGMGAGINLWCGSLTMTGGYIINNQAYQSAGGAGGGIYADCYTANQATVNIQAGDITGNSRYGVVYHSSMVNFSRTGGNIINNTPDNLFPWV